MYRTKMLLQLIGSAFILLTAASFCYADFMEFGSSMNPVGAGARAMGMGGAFIAVADDATAASWNPAGLVQLEKPEISAVYSFFDRGQRYYSDTHPELNSRSEMSANGLNFASAAYPFVAFNRNVVVSLNFQRLFEMNKTINYEYHRIDSIGGTHIDKIDFLQTGSLYAMSPAVALQLSPGLFIGGTLNIWGKGLFKNGWNSNLHVNDTGSTPSGIPINLDTIEKKRTDFSGLNGNLGFLWNVNGQITVGAVFKTPFISDLRIHTKTHHVFRTQGIEVHDYFQDSDNKKMKIPASYGLGISYRHSDAWSVAFDVYRTEWSHFWVTDEVGKKKNPLTGNFLSEGRPTDTNQVRLGTEYLFIKDKYVVPVRFGLFYDPEPAIKSPDDYYGFSVGTGYSTSRFAVDAAYQYRTGRKVDSDIGHAVKGTTADVTQQTLLISIIYYFDK